MTWYFIFIKMLMVCHTNIQFIIKWFHWMIQFCREIVIFFMLKQFNTALIQASMAYSTNITRSLFCLLKEILNLVISFFLFLVPRFLYSACFPWCPCSLLFYVLLYVLGFPGTLIFGILFYSLGFFGIIIVCIPAAPQNFPYSFPPICNIWCSIFHIFFLFILLYGFFLIHTSLFTHLSFLFLYHRDISSFYLLSLSAALLATPPCSMHI